MGRDSPGRTWREERPPETIARRGARMIFPKWPRSIIAALQLGALFLGAGLAVSALPFWCSPASPGCRSECRAPVPFMGCLRRRRWWDPRCGGANRPRAAARCRSQSSGRSSRRESRGGHGHGRRRSGPTPSRPVPGGRSGHSMIRNSLSHTEVRLKLQDDVWEARHANIRPHGTCRDQVGLIRSAAVNLVEPYQLRRSWQAGAPRPNSRKDVDEIGGL